MQLGPREPRGAARGVEWRGWFAEQLESRAARSGSRTSRCSGASHAERVRAARGVALRKHMARRSSTRAAPRCSERGEAPCGPRVRATPNLAQAASAPSRPAPERSTQVRSRPQSLWNVPPRQVEATHTKSERVQKPQRTRQIAQSSRKATISVGPYTYQFTMITRK